MKKYFNITNIFLFLAIFVYMPLSVSGGEDLLITSIFIAGALILIILYQKGQNVSDVNFPKLLVALLISVALGILSGFALFACGVSSGLFCTGAPLGSIFVLVAFVSYFLRFIRDGLHKNRDKKTTAFNR